MSKSKLKNGILIVNDTQEITGISTTLIDSGSVISDNTIPTSKAVYDILTLSSDSRPCTIIGNWANPQYVSSPVDYTGLIFLATLPNGNVINATVSSVSPSTWSSTVGTQTATFTCTAGGFSFTATKSASVKVKGDPVGGTIFYIDSGSTNTYTFYNAQGQEVSAPSVGTDCTNWTYTKSGSSVDKFYVYESTTGAVADRNWGYYYITTSATGNSIGAGKTNTSKVLAITDTSEYASSSIWEYIRDMRVNKVNGCDDWFIGCPAEYDKLGSSGTTGASWFSSKYVWSSREHNSVQSYRHSSAWYQSEKRQTVNVLIPIRAF